GVSGNGELTKASSETNRDGRKCAPHNRLADWPWTERSAHRWVGNTCWGDAKNQGRQQIRLFAEITVRRKGRRCYGEWYRREAKLNQLNRSGSPGQPPADSPLRNLPIRQEL